MIYENDNDRANERAIIDAVKAAWRLDAAIKLERNFVLDFALLADREIYGLAEVKDRPGLGFGFGGMDDGYRIAVNKLFAAQQWRSAMRLPTWLVVRFVDGVIYTAELTHPMRTIFNGRHDRPLDALAIEPLAVIPWRAFTRLTADD
jgi:hypothetical protein